MAFEDVPFSALVDQLPAQVGPHPLIVDVYFASSRPSESVAHVQLVTAFILYSVLESTQPTDMGLVTGGYPAPTQVAETGRVPEINPPSEHMRPVMGLTLQPGLGGADGGVQVHFVAGPVHVP